MGRDHYWHLGSTSRCDEYTRVWLRIRLVYSKFCCLEFGCVSDERMEPAVAAIGVFRYQSVWDFEVVNNLSLLVMLDHIINSKISVESIQC